MNRYHHSTAFGTACSDTSGTDTALSSLKGLEHLPNLVDAIINQQPLKIHYRTFNQREFEVTCHPYYIKLHNNRWFLLAWTKQYNQLGYYTLERIVTFNKEAVPYICINKEYDLGEYFDAITLLE